MESRSLRISLDRDRLVKTLRWTTNFIYASYPAGSIRHMMTGPYESLRDLKEEVNLALAEEMLMPRTPVRLGQPRVRPLERWFDQATDPASIGIPSIGVPVLSKIRILDVEIAAWRQAINHTPVNRRRKVVLGNDPTMICRRWMTRMVNTNDRLGLPGEYSRRVNLDRVLRLQRLMWDSIGDWLRVESFGWIRGQPIDET